LVWVYVRAQRLFGGAGQTTLALDIGLAIMLGGLVGARALHVFYEDFQFYLENPIDVIKLWRGGFVFYGGFFGALLAVYLFLRQRGEPFLKWGDFYAPVLALGYGLGRIACFLNGCCFGRECDLPWAVEFVHTGLPSGLRHPTQLYATLWELLIVGLLLYLEKSRSGGGRWSRLKAGSLFFIWLSLHSFGRLVMEFFRGDFRGDLVFGFSISTWISLFLLGVSATLLARSLTSSPSVVGKTGQ
jgi:phosphatidylglycerol---prolipoprotein diacylglyceryl transferase